MLTGAQIRMARGGVRWSVRDLAEASGVSPATIKRMEEVQGVPKSIADNLLKIQNALEAAGVEFHPRGGVFFTPHEVVERMVDLIGPSREGSTNTSDPTVGTGSCLSGETKRG